MLSCAYNGIQECPNLGFHPKGEKTMKRMMMVTIAFLVFSSFALFGQSFQSAEASVKQEAQDTAAADSKVLREYRGIKLGLKRDVVRSTMGKPENLTDNSEDYKLTGEDMMTVHYDNNEVKAIQLQFLDPKNAPAWDTVVGDAEVTQLENGAKHARKVIAKENFWVSIYQNKDASITRVTISKQ